MKKNIFAVIFCIAAVLSTVTAKAAENEDTLAAQLMPHIGGEEFFRLDKEVTRGEFTSAAVKLFFGENCSSGTAHYSDVVQSDSISGRINYACEIGIVGEAEKFYPDSPIKTAEALKILMEISGYSIYARDGGYPSGYVDTGVQYGFLDGIDLSGQTLTGDKAYRLIYNCMTAKTIKTEYKNSKTEYYESGHDYLYTIYNIEKCKGTVTDVNYRSITSQGLNNGKLGIDGMQFDYEEADISILGKHAVYYKKTDENEITALITDENTELSVPAEDIISLRDGTLKYYEDHSTRSKKVRTSATTVYNGRAADGFDISFLDANCADVRFFDNDKDGVFDIIFVNRTDYRKVNSVDNVNEIISFEDYGNMKLNGRECIDIKDLRGEDVKLYELNVGDKLAIRESSDGAIAEITLLDDVISGKAEGFANKKIRIDGMEYKYSSEIEEKYIKNNIISAGAAITGILGLENQIAFIDSITNVYEYGYIKKLAVSDADFANEDKVILKLFNSSGKHENVQTREKVLIDGKQTKSIQQTYDALKAKLSGGGCFVRYCIDNDGKISKLDFEEKFNPKSMEFGKEQDTDNQLLCYNDKETLRYRGASKAFPPYCMVSSSVIFKIPQNPEDNDGFGIMAVSDLFDNEDYKVSSYNIDENGRAAAIVLYFTSTNDSYIAQYCDSFIVERTGEAVNEDGEIGKTVYGWAAGEFKTEFIPDDAKILKTSGNEIGSGDIIRLKKIKDRVIEVSVDYDCSNGSPVADKNNGGVWDRPLGDRYCAYFDGGVYSFSGETVVYSEQTNDDGTYNFSFPNLRVYASSDKAVCYNREKKTLRIINSSEVKGYTGYGTECQRVIIRQSYARTKSIFIIE